MWNTGLHEASIEKLTHEKTKIIQNSSKKMSSEQWRREDILTWHAFFENYLVYKISKNFSLQYGMESSGHPHKYDIKKK